MKNQSIHKLMLQSLFFMLYAFTLKSYAETDTITPNFSIKDPQILTSPANIFKLGFVTPNKATNRRYLAVFHAVSEDSVIWIANRGNPLLTSDGVAALSRDGNLVLLDGSNGTVWSTNVSVAAPVNATAQILDSGNLVVKDGGSGRVIWESFLHPSNVFVPTLRMSQNVETGYRVLMSSWKDESNPEIGNYSAGLEARNIPQIFVWKNGYPHWRSGPWNGRILTGVVEMYKPFLFIYFSLFTDRNGTFHFTLPSPEQNLLIQIVLNSSGNLVEKYWDVQHKKWEVTWVAQKNDCDLYGKCGPFGICNARESPICSCLRGFEPAEKEEWGKGDWSGGCVRSRALECDNGDGFLNVEFMKVPDFAEQMLVGEEDECRRRCLMNCSCVAYSYGANVSCMMWSRSLIDMQKFAGVGALLRVRLPISELADNSSKKTFMYAIPVAVASVFVFVLCVIGWFCWMANRSRKRAFAEGKDGDDSRTGIATLLKDETDKFIMKELRVFSLDSIAKATNEFHNRNMLGKGGFGIVYMGKLENEEQIAVKRLSAASGQGTKEFLNEMKVISKLQHLNLVRLHGCCVENQEKMLIYEYMPNKSLDLCLFDPNHPLKKTLDWKKRFHIIEGITRGLLYLHKDSRLKIIHRDLKPSNVLLDEDMNPKISDFGMARIFGGSQDQANTTKVVGTYGYMAPEYAMEGKISEKTDVYSFGVMMLEIVSGLRHTRYYNHESSLSLLGYAWKLWYEGKCLDFVDQTMEGVYDFEQEMTLCTHIGLLCVQEFPKNRPTIEAALSMLHREILDLPLPNQPIFAEKWNRFQVGSTQSMTELEAL